MKQRNFFGAFFDGESIFPIVIQAPENEHGEIVNERAKIVRVANKKDLKYPDWQGKCFGPAMNCTVIKTIHSLSKARKMALKNERHAKMSFHYWMRWEKWI